MRLGIEKKERVDVTCSRYLVEKRGTHLNSRAYGRGKTVNWEVGRVNLALFRFWFWKGEGPPGKKGKRRRRQLYDRIDQNKRGEETLLSIESSHALECEGLTWVLSLWRREVLSLGVCSLPMSSVPRFPDSRFTLRASRDSTRDLTACELEKDSFLVSVLVCSQSLAFSQLSVSRWQHHCQQQHYRHHHHPLESYRTWCWFAVVPGGQELHSLSSSTSSFHPLFACTFVVRVSSFRRKDNVSAKTEDEKNSTQ